MVGMPWVSMQELPANPGDDCAQALPGWSAEPWAGARSGPEGGSLARSDGFALIGTGDQEKEGTGGSRRRLWCGESLINLGWEEERW